MIFKVELTQIGERKAARFTKSDEDLLQEAKTLKNQGNEFFKKQDFKQAESKYREALTEILRVVKKNQETQDLTKALHLNISVVCNKSGNNKEVIYNCTKALNIDSKATKALFLRA